MGTPISKIYSLLLAIITGLSVTACVYDDMPDTPDKEAEQYGFCLRLVTSTPVTSRATGDTYADGTYNEEGSVNENMIDMAGGDFKVLLFSGYGDNAVLIEAPEFKISVSKEDYTEYIVWSRIPASFFKDNNINSDSEHDYQLMVLANWKSLGGSYPDVIPGTTTVASIKISDKRLLTGYNPSGWYPFENGHKGIPMYGLLPFKAKQRELYLHFDEDGKIVPNLETLYLLRAMAKLEIIDRTGEAIDNPNERLNPWIDKIHLSSYNRNGCVIPYVFVNKQQVTAPTYHTNSNADSDGCYLNNRTNNDRPNFNNRDTVFTAYLFEQDLENLNLNFEIHKRKMVKENWWSTTEIEQEEIQYDTKSITEIITQQSYKGAFLRNHIYRIYVTLNINAKIELKYVVCPWGKENIDIPPFD
jgi:lipoprotein